MSEKIKGTEQRSVITQTVSMCIHTFKDSIREVNLCVDQVLIYRVTISHNPRFRTSTGLCTSGQPLAGTSSSAAFFCIHIAAGPLMTQQPQEEWSTLASSLMVQSNPSSQRMASRVQLWLHYPSSVLLDTQLP